MSSPWPVDLIFSRSARKLILSFDDKTQFEIPYKMLREQSPSAENKGHGNKLPPQTRPVPVDIDVVGADPVGRYAIRIRFSDGHATGLYTWTLLREIGEAAQRA